MSESKPQGAHFKGQDIQPDRIFQFCSSSENMKRRLGLIFACLAQARAECFDAELTEG